MGRHRIVLLGSALSVFNLGATVLVGFFLMPFLVHHLGDRMYGYWALVGAVLGYYGLLDLGIGRAVQFTVGKAIGGGDLESPNRALSTAAVAFTVVGLIALAITIVVAACSPFFITSPSDVTVFRIVMVIMGLGFAVGLPGRVFIGAVNAHLRTDLSTLVSIVVLILRTALIVGAIVKGKGLIALALISMLCEATSYVAHYLILRKIQKSLRISFRLADRSMFKELFNYGRFSVIIQVGDQLRFALDAWMVAAFVGVTAVAHYSIASRLSNYFMSFIVSVVAVLGAWFTQLLGAQDFNKMRKVLALGTRVAAALSTIVACSFVFYGRAFISTWMGPNYVDAYWPSVILIAAIFFDLAQQPSVTFLLGTSRHRFLAYQTIAEGVANLILSMYWARSYGMIGVAMGTLVPMVVAKLFVQPWYVCRSVGISLTEYYLKVLGGSVLFPALCSLALWALLLRRIELANLGTVCLIVALQSTLCAVAAFFFVFDAEGRRGLLSKFFPRSAVDPGAASSVNVA